MKQGWVVSGLWAVLFLVPGFARAGVLDEAGQCLGDANRDAQVTVNEIIGGVNNALDGCGFQPVTIRFHGQVGERQFACGESYDGIGTGGATITPSDFRFYVSEMRLLGGDGREYPVLLDQDGIWQREDLALIDFENKDGPCTLGTTATNEVVRGQVAPGSYQGIRFTVGVPFRHNHGDASVAPSPLNLTSLFWNWQGGYKFLRIDTADEYALRLHFGSTGCQLAGPNFVTGCARANRAEVILAPFDPEHDHIVADIAALLADNDVSVNHPETPKGCMAGPADTDCEPMMRNFGVIHANGLPAPGLQKFFRVQSHDHE